MTKNLFGLLFIAPFCLTTTLSAVPIVVPCSLTSGSDTATATANGAQPTFSGVFTCNVPTPPVGNALSSVDLIIDDDYALGTSGSNNEVEFSYSTSDFTGAATLTTTVLGVGGTSPFGVSSTEGGILGQSATPTCSTDAVNVFDCEEPNGSLTPPGTPFTVTGSSSWFSGSLQNGGTDQFSVSFSYTTTPVATPEPATLLLTGVGGLAGLILAARRRLKASRISQA